MIYILNNRIEYNSDTAEVFQLGSNIDIAKFTPILNRIFRILVENNKMIVPRDELLKQVWNDHGLNASVNTLNQYISTLRKLLSQHLDIDNAILNIPKKGIILSSEIVITFPQVDEINSSELATAPEKLNEMNKPALVELDINNNNEPVYDSNSSSIASKVTTSKTSKRNFFLKITFAAILVLFSIYNLFFNTLKFEKVNTYLVSAIESCPVYSFKNNFDNVHDPAIIQEHIKEFSLRCDNEAIFYYYNNHDNPRAEKQSMLAKCEENKMCISTRINR